MIGKQALISKRLAKYFLPPSNAASSKLEVLSLSFVSVFAPHRHHTCLQLTSVVSIRILVRNGAFWGWAGYGKILLTHLSAWRSSTWPSVKPTTWCVIICHLLARRCVTSSDGTPTLAYRLHGAKRCHTHGQHRTNWLSTGIRVWAKIGYPKLGGGTSKHGLFFFCGLNFNIWIQQLPCTDACWLGISMHITRHHSISVSVPLWWAKVNPKSQNIPKKNAQQWGQIMEWGLPHRPARKLTLWTQYHLHPCLRRCSRALVVRVPSHHHWNLKGPTVSEMGCGGDLTWEVIPLD